MYMYVYFVSVPMCVSQHMFTSLPSVISQIIVMVKSIFWRLCIYFTNLVMTTMMVPTSQSHTPPKCWPSDTPPPPPTEKGI